MVLIILFLQKMVTLKPCMWNGMKRPCYLFARKFYPETLDNMIQLFSNYTAIWFINLDVILWCGVCLLTWGCWIIPPWNPLSFCNQMTDGATGMTRKYCLWLGLRGGYLMIHYTQVLVRCLFSFSMFRFIGSLSSKFC